MAYALHSKLRINGMMQYKFEIRNQELIIHFTLCRIFSILSRIQHQNHLDRVLQLYIKILRRSVEKYGFYIVCAAESPSFKNVELKAKIFSSDVSLGKQTNTDDYYVCTCVLNSSLVRHVTLLIADNRECVSRGMN